MPRLLYVIMLTLAAAPFATAQTNGHTVFVAGARLNR